MAYILWLLLGGVGAHRFYAGRVGTGIIYVAMQVFGWVTATAGPGTLFFLAIAIWWLIDAFLIPGMIRQNNLALHHKGETSEIV